MSQAQGDSFRKKLSILFGQCLEKVEVRSLIKTAHKGSTLGLIGSLYVTLYITCIQGLIQKPIIHKIAHYFNSKDVTPKIACLVQFYVYRYIHECIHTHVKVRGS